MCEARFLAYAVLAEKGGPVVERKRGAVTQTWWPEDGPLYRGTHKARLTAYHCFLRRRACVEQKVVTCVCGPRAETRLELSPSLDHAVDRGLKPTHARGVVQHVVVVVQRDELPEP